MKFTKRHENQIREFMALADEYGRLSTSEWTSGSGRNTKPKALPPFVKRFDRDWIETLKRDAWPRRGTPERAALYYFDVYPRRKAVLVMDKAALADFLFTAAHLRDFWERA